MEITLLKDILVIFGLSVLVLFVFHRLKIPVIVGFLITGILAGPHGLGLVKAVHAVELLAEIGIVLLLFAIGIEFSFDKLFQIRKTVLLGGFLQVFLTSAATAVIARSFGTGFGESVFLGFLVSLSSTAIVLKLILERAEFDSPQGRGTLGILIFQDIIIVPMMLVTPLLAELQGPVGESLVITPLITFIITLAKGVVIILLVIFAAKWVVPHLLYQVVKTRNHELFLLSIVALGLAVAWFTSSIGLSLALGAFLAGLIVSESEYSHQALSNILPFRDVFTSFFFVSVGMLMDVGILLRHPIYIILAALIVLGLKALTGVVAGLSLGFPFRLAVLVGLALSQVGEFSFILSRTGIEHGLLSGDNFQWFLSVSVLTMALTPFIMNFSPKAADVLSRLPLPKRVKLGWYQMGDTDEVKLSNHVIIIGYGINGKNVARAASLAVIPYLIIEMNAETVREEREKGEPIYFGDAAQESILRHANINDARVVVIAISDPVSTRRIIELARRLNPKVYIIVRTRYVQEVEPLYNMGADEVIPEEYETSVEIFAAVLKKYLVPREEIEKYIADIRSDGYEMLRTLSKKQATYADLKLHLPDVEMCALRVDEKAPAAGKTLAQMELRKKHDVTILALRRNGEILYNPHGDDSIHANDVMVIVGRRNKIADVAGLFRNPEKEPHKCKPD